MNDCAFQYATKRKIIEDTPLISRAEAEALWQKYLPDFVKRLKNEEEPEMAIWIDMKDKYSYGKTAIHWTHDSVLVHNNAIYIYSMSI